MEISSQSCRICLSVSEFNVSLFGNYCTRTNMIDKILVCLKIIVEKTDGLSTICYKCAENVERFYEFSMNVKKSQNLFDKQEHLKHKLNNNMNPSAVNRHVTSYVREQVIDADYSFSFLELFGNKDDKKDTKQSSPFFSYFSPQNIIVKQSNETVSKTSRICLENVQKEFRRDDCWKRKLEKPKQLSGDIFESQSDLEETEFKRPEWKLTPDENLIRRVREKCFGRSDF